MNAAAFFEGEGVYFETMVINYSDLDKFMTLTQQRF